MCETSAHAASSVLLCSGSLLVRQSYWLPRGIRTPALPRTRTHLSDGCVRETAVAGISMVTVHGSRTPLVFARSGRYADSYNFSASLPRNQEIVPMSDVTRILTAIEKGDSQAAEQLLPLVYEELRKLAAEKMSQERSGHTLDGTALVHEAYLRLIDGPNDMRWGGRGHFFAAAAEAMRRILIDHARKRRSLKRGGSLARLALDESAVASPELSDQMLALDEALEKLASVDAQSAELVKLKFFGGLTLREAAECLGIAPRTADDLWAYSRAWLFRAMNADP